MQHTKKQNLKLIKEFKKRIIIISLLVSVVSISCDNKQSEDFERKIATDIAEFLIENDTLNLKQYSNDIALHIAFRRLNEKTYKTFVSLNGLKTKSDKLRKEEIMIGELKTIIYYSQSNLELDLPEPFFVPDTKGWIFLAEYYNNELFISQLTKIYLDKNSTTELPDELDL